MTALDVAPARQRLVLASTSPIRAALLRQAGVTIETDPARLDETEVKTSFRAEGASAAACAEALAELKAQRVSGRHPGALVVGADQMLECEGVWFDKPLDRAQAADQLRALRGKTHTLVAAVVAVSDGRRLWQHVAHARLTMRPFSDAFLSDYLDRVGDRATESVGAYQLEADGVQLFAHIDGDHFTILGLPLLPLLGFLRDRGILPT
jgi:septum formation protein